MFFRIIFAIRINVYNYILLFDKYKCYDNFVMKKEELTRGIKAGLPIGLGYLSVSFTFGIMAISAGLSWWQALLISMLNLTSAGQLAGINIMVNPGMYIQMLLTQITINIRYSFMSISLAQKLDNKFTKLHRFLLGAIITDEIFGVAITEEKISKEFLTGLAILPYIGWTSGTLFGALLGAVLPNDIMNALNIALYAMFIAIIIPEARKSKEVLVVIIIAILLSSLFTFIDVLNKLSAGLNICICAIVAATLGALLFPIKTNYTKEEKNG